MREGRRSVVLAAYHVAVRGLGIDDEFEPGRLLDRQVGRLGALKDVAGVDADLTIRFRDVASVAHQPAGCDSGAIRISGRNLVTHGQGDKLLAATLEKPVGSDKEDIIRVDIIPAFVREPRKGRSEEHTSELQSRQY